jgi:hypothetical protein
MALTAQDKRRIKNRKIAKTMANAEPTIEWLSKEDQDAGLGFSLTWYSTNTGKKEQKKYALDYFKTVDKSIYTRLKDLDDWRFMTFGSICRMMSFENGYRQEWTTSKFFDTKLQELLAVYEQEKEKIEEQARILAKSNVSKPKPLTIQQRIFNAAAEIGGEFDEQIDIFTTTGNFTSDFKAKSFLAEQGVSATVAGRVAEFFVPVMEELSDAYDRKDEQLVEGYSHLTRTNLRRLRDFVKGLVEETQQFAQSAKKPVKRRPRAVIPAKVVARVKCQRKDESLGLVSIAPVKMLDTSEIWVYNTKYKKLQCYVSDGTPLSVKGTTIVGFDLKKSIQQTVRNPEKFFKGLSIGKRALSNAMKSIKTKASAPNGRLNENCIILGAF